MRSSRENTHKKNIVNNICNRVGIPSNFASNLVDHLIKILISNIRLSKTFKIKNFGTFFLLKKNERIGRNPKNNTKHTISERNVITFKASENLKKKINNNVKK